MQLVRLLMFIRKHPWSIGTAALLLLWILILGLNPLRRSEIYIHDWLMRSVPTGCNQAQLLKIAQSKGWVVQASWKGQRSESSSPGIAGESVVRIHLGWYLGPLRTDVDSFWAFDEHDHLIDVRVSKDVDAP